MIASDVGMPGLLQQLERQPASIAPADEVRIIDSDALFAGHAEVRIEHRGAVYRLKQTALGKLILTK
jgi:hemin uptake protein HemP